MSLGASCKRILELQQNVKVNLGLGSRQSGTGHVILSEKLYRCTNKDAHEMSCRLKSMDRKR